jgi:hypothetical protein
VTNRSEAVIGAGPARSVATAASSRQPVSDLRLLASRGLKQMYRPDTGLFVFRLRLNNGAAEAQGTSVRYTAIALLGLASEAPADAKAILAGETAQAVCERVTRSLPPVTNLGDAALVCWAAGALGCAGHGMAMDRLLAHDPAAGECSTVELSWALSALCGESTERTRARRDEVAARLMALYSDRGRGFPYRAGGGARLRAHVACFADQVYPILALSQYAAVGGNPRAIAVARATADQLCRLQGEAGQWWWHYHAHAGTVVERYPVYAVHQHAMTPMALAALERVSGADYQRPIDKGLEWLRSSPEIGGASLIDPAVGLIWRKVGRREPLKASRYLQAAATRLHPAAKFPGVDRWFPPGAIDFESRPYELGWLLFAWPLNAG